MVLQSRTPAILLTRPLVQSQRFARSLRVAWADRLNITISPLMQVAFLVPLLPSISPGGLIFSSETAVAAYVRLPDRLAAPAWCIGQRTQNAAKRAGLETVFWAQDAATLLSQMIAARPPGPFLHLRGEDSHGEIAATLTSAGIPAAEAVVYAQRPTPISLRAIQLLQSNRPVIVPLFSARSAQLFCDAAPKGAQTRFAVLSAAVASAIPPDRTGPVVVSARPDAKAMLESVKSLLREPSLA